MSHSIYLVLDMMNDLVHADDRPAYRRMRDEMQRGLHGTDTAECRLVHREGQIVWTKSSVRALSAGNGHRHFHCCIQCASRK